MFVLAISLNGISQTNNEFLNQINTQFQPDTAYIQEEVCVLLTKKSELAVAWIDRKKGTDEKLISYTISYQNKTKWYPIRTYDSKEFIWTGNPAFAEDDNNNIYLVSMSIDYFTNHIPTAAILEICKTQDGGQNWSDWTTIKRNNDLGSNMPDKPTIIAKGDGELFLSYINFNLPEGKFLEAKGDVVFTKSTDHGKTWSNNILIDNKRGWKPNTIFKMILTGEADMGEQGPSLSFVGNNILLSYGSYKGKGIWLTISEDLGNSFGEVKRIAKTETPLPVTDIITDNKNRIIITVFNPHGVGKAYILESNDGGKTFEKPKCISKNASLLTGNFDQKGNVILLWNEKTKENVDTKYMVIGKDGEKSYSLYSDKKPITKFYIGAYQDLVVDENNIIHLFWIDWSIEGGKLIYSTCK